MPGAEYPVQLTCGVPVLTVPAEIDITMCEALREVLARWCGLGYAAVVVDLSDTVFCDLAGLRELVLAHKGAQADGGGLRLVTPVGGVFPRVFALSGLDGAIPHFATVDQALAGLSAPASQQGRGGGVGGPPAGRCRCVLGDAVPAADREGAGVPRAVTRTAREERP